MNDKEVGELWRYFSAANNCDSPSIRDAVLNLIRKLVEAGTQQLQSEGYLSESALEIALRRYGIDPATWLVVT